MRIQEMKSGLTHLKKRMGSEMHELYTQPSPFDAVAEPDGLPLAADCELDEPRWSVVSFAQREAGGLTYLQAAALMTELDNHGVAGLCIIIDEAAARIR